MKHGFLILWIAMGVADEHSSLIGAQHGGQEIVIANNEPARGIIIGGFAVAGGMSADYLWTHHQKRAAIVVTAISAVTHGWAIQHNLNLNRR